MKKKRFACLALALVMLAGCGGGQGRAAEEGSAGGAEVRFEMGDGEIKRLGARDGLWDTAGAQTASGYYELVKFTETGYNILYTDAQTATRIYLCSRPECSHADESCTSWVNYSAGGCSITAYGDSLFLFVHGAPNDRRQADAEQCGRIIRLDADGGNRRTVKVFEPWQAVESAVMCDGKYMYFILQEYEGETDEYSRWIAALEMEGGKMTKLEELAAGEGWYLVGTAEKCLLLDHKVYPTNWLTGWEGSYENMKNTRREICAYRPESGEMQVLKTGAQPDWQYRMTDDGGMVYLDFTGPDMRVKKQDLFTGETREIAAGLTVYGPLNGYERTSIDGLWDGQLQYHTSDLPVDGKVVYENFWVDLESGEVRPAALFTKDHNDNTVPVPVEAEFGEELLVWTGWGEANKLYYYADGRAETRNIFYSKRALINREDYWAGRANYREPGDQVFS